MTGGSWDQLQPLEIQVDKLGGLRLVTFWDDVA